MRKYMRKYRLKNDVRREDVDPSELLFGILITARTWRKTLIVSDIAEYILNIRRRYQFHASNEVKTYRCRTYQPCFEVDMKIGKQLKAHGPQTDFKSLERTAVPIDILLAQMRYLLGLIYHGSSDGNHRPAQEYC